MSYADTLMKSTKAAEVIVDRSVCTVISALPFRLNEQKPGLFPIGLFALPPVKKAGDVNVLVVNEGHYFTYIGDGKSIAQYEKATIIAQSIVNDYNNSQLGLDTTSIDPMEHAKPALFFVFGAWTKEQVLERFQEEIELAHIQQNKWFGNLVKQADDDWAKYHQHKMISDLQRFAANSLKLVKEWSNPELVANSSAQCPACKSFIPQDALICNVCRTIVNKKAYDDLGLKQAG